MPDAHPNRPSGGTGPLGPSAAPIAAPPWPPPPAAPKRGRWLPFLTLAIALVALGVGIGAWLRPMPSPSPDAGPAEPSYTEEQVAAAKANVCEAFGLVKQGVVINTHRTNPVPGDAIGDLATGLHAPVMLYDGGDYLLGNLAMEPATPPELTDAIKSLGSIMKKLAMIELAVGPDAVRDAVKQTAEAGSATIDELCK